MVSQGYEKNTVASLDHLLPADSRHKILQGYSIESLNERSVVLDKEHEEFGKEIEFDYCILSTVRFSSLAVSVSRARLML